MQGHGTTFSPHANGHDMEAFGHGMPCPYGGWANGYLGRRLCPQYCHTLEYSIVTPVNIVLSRPRPREGKKNGPHRTRRLLTTLPLSQWAKMAFRRSSKSASGPSKGSTPHCNVGPRGSEAEEVDCTENLAQYSTSTPSPLRGTPPVSGGESAGAEETVINIEKHHPACPMGQTKIPGHMDRVKYAARAVAYWRCNNSSLFLIEWCNLNRA